MFRLESFDAYAFWDLMPEEDVQKANASRLVNQLMKKVDVRAIEPGLGVDSTVPPSGILESMKRTSSCTLESKQNSLNPCFHEVKCSETDGQMNRCSRVCVSVRRIDSFHSSGP